MATPDTSVSTIKFFIKSGKTKTDMSFIFFFNYVKAKSTYVLHVNLVEHNISVRGAARVE